MRNQAGREDGVTFSYDVKSELALLKIERKIEALIELSTMAGLNASVSLQGGDLSLRFFSEHPDVILRVTELVKKLYKLKPEVYERSDSNLQIKPIYRTGLSGQALEMFLEESGYDIMGKAKAPVADILSRLNPEKNAKAYLRGAFLASGSVVDPEKSYHLEIILKNPQQCRCLEHVAKVLGLEFKKTMRNDDHVYYIKDSENISNFLVDVGAGKAMLELENIRISKEVSNDINRQVNAETANFDKQIKASAVQIQHIDKIASKVGLDKLPESLRQVAYTRLKNPEASLKELGEKMSPKLGKSGVNHRLKRIKEISDKL